MLLQYTSYEIEVLRQLAGYRNTLSPDRVLAQKSRKKSKDVVNSLQEDIDNFCELFCSHNFADTDYSIIQNTANSFESQDKWIESLDIATVLQSITYVIWTNKINKDYFVSKINDRFLQKVLTRLHTILEAYTAATKKQTPLSPLGTLKKKAPEQPLVKNAFGSFTRPFSE